MSVFCTTDVFELDKKTLESEEGKNEVTEVGEEVEEATN